MKVKDSVINKINEYYEGYRSNIWIICSILVCLILGMSKIESQYNFELIAILMIFSWMCVYFVKNIREFYLQCIMMFSFFLFLLDRPLIGFLRGYAWWESYQQAIHTVLMIILILLVSFWSGSLLSKREINRKARSECEKQLKLFNNMVVKYGATIIYIFSILSKCYVEFRQYLKLRNMDYTAMYLGIQLELPLWLRILSGLSVFLLAVVLSYNFSKKISFVLLSLYVLSGSFDFLLGNRTSLMAKMLFALIYYCIRHFSTNRKEIWLGKIEKTIISVMIPVCVIGLGIMNYTRSNEKAEVQSGVGVVSDFFYKQGTTFETVCQGVSLKNELREEEKLYTIGPIRDYLNDSTLGQIVFGTTPIPDGNNIIRAKEGHDMSHHLSYHVMGEKYLEGNGRGSSFILEAYMDFDYIGVAIFAFLLGVFCTRMKELCKNQCLYVIILIVLTELFMITRSSALGVLLFIVQPQFWLMWILLFGLYVINQIVTNISRRKARANF
ncbi:MAG: O-antigen polysaccharide polymerase Wzy family protein [Blautia sp.]|uniref:O-antigen polysaccharide polymerase Wzy family protein n=1 Tax=Blautia sp. TaxID=1955243 RepID=UPI002E7A1FB7|nr:O-antigen polysaccharide polymerase Wzy family protein [Blautia sp.]MEE1443485.1 O-antigen polysaccharide polymerase Wzy family protein [Blautia sp.]